MLKVHRCWICTMLDNSPKQWWTTLCSYHNIYFLHCFSPRLFSCFRQKKSLSALCFSVLQIKILHSFEWFLLACHRLSTRPQADVTSVLYCDMAITMNHFILFFFFFLTHTAVGAWRHSGQPGCNTRCMKAIPSPDCRGQQRITHTGDTRQENISWISSLWTELENLIIFKQRYHGMLI